MDRRLLAYVVFALVLGPILISTLPLIAPESGVAREGLKAASPEVSESEKGFERGEGSLRSMSLPLLYLLDLSIALLVYLITRHLIPVAS